MKEFTLTKKTQLTSDVFELHYSSNESVEHLAGQFITFILPNGIGGKSYSLLSSQGQNFVLIIKRVADGKGGSKFLCDAQVGDVFTGVGPVGKFVLQEYHNSKLFAGTGTGIVPLYNQICTSLESGNKAEMCLLFGVRTREDLFYVEQLENLEKQYTNFQLKVALSREASEEYYNGYITDFVTQQCSEDYDEAYLCGAPVVVDSMKEALVSKNFEEDKIFSEKY